MEQHLMWLKSKHVFKAAPILGSSFNTTWEEEAFAEDSAGPLGGFVWPPRSYSCTFCRREFRSAQALGGHMNVHRRDRARLKHSLSLQTADHLQLKNPTQLTTPSTLHPQVGNFSSVSRASSKVTQENSSGQSQVSPSVTANNKEQQRCSGQPLSLISNSNSRAVPLPSDRKCARKELLVTLDDRERSTTVETNLTMGIHLRDSHNNLRHASSNEEITMNSKRHKKSSSISSFAFFHKPCSSNRYIFQTEVLRIKTNSLEDIDLELRLGNSPAVK